MGSDLPRLLGSSPPLHGNPNCPLPRLSELDVYSHAASPPASGSASSWSVGDNPLASPALPGQPGQPGPLLTTPPASSAGVSSSQRTAWTAINHPPPNTNFQESQRDCILSRGLPSPLTEPQRPASSRSAARPGPAPTPQCGKAHRDGRRTPLASPCRVTYPEPSGLVSPPCSIPPQHAGLSPNLSPEALARTPLQQTLASSHLASHPTTPPQPVASPNFGSHVGKPSAYSTSVYYTPNSPACPTDTPESTNEFTKREQDTFVFTHGSPIPVPAPQYQYQNQSRPRSRGRSVRFAAQPSNLQIMRQVPSESRQAQAPPEHPQGAGKAHSEDSLGHGYPVSAVRTTESDHLATNAHLPQQFDVARISPAISAGEHASSSPPEWRCNRCRSAAVEDLQSILDQPVLDRGPFSMANKSLEDYHRGFDAWVESLRKSRRARMSMSEKCPECDRLLSPESVEVIRIALLNRAPGSQNPDFTTQPGKRKSPSSYASSDAEASFKSRKITPDTPSLPLGESVLPDSTSPHVPSTSESRNRPTIPFSVADHAFKALVDSRGVLEEMPLGPLLTLTARNMGLAQNAETANSQTQPDHNTRREPESPMHVDETQSQRQTVASLLNNRNIPSDEIT